MKSFGRFELLTVLLTITIASFIGADQPVQATSDRILEKARLILTSQKDAKYEHKTHVVEAEGVYHLDCSGLLCHILKKISPVHLSEIPVAAGHSRALALQFYEAFIDAGKNGKNGWVQIQQMKKAKPGDVLDWRLEKQIEGHDTGHVMIIDESPVEDSPTLFKVAIIDSTKSPHLNDTRKDGATGVGRGTIWIVTNEAGHPIGYHWKSKTGKMHEIQIAIGRATEVKGK